MTHEGCAWALPAGSGTRFLHKAPEQSGASFFSLETGLPSHTGTHMIKWHTENKIMGTDGENAAMTDFSTITACGECCAECPKKLDGRCPGCIEADGCVPEWAESGRCRIHACTRDHHAQFCGLCAKFPCARIPSLISWNHDIVEHLTALRNEYRETYPHAGGTATKR